MAAKKKVNSKKKTNGKSKSLATRKGTSIANVDSELAKEVKTMEERIGAPSGNKINIGDNTFQFPNGKTVTGPCELVIIDFITTNAYYGEKKYDANNPTPPVCYAWGRGKNETLSPVPESPLLQCDACEPCIQFEWPQGGSRPCKNNRLLAVIDPSADEPSVMLLSVSPTGLTRFDALVSTIKDVYSAPPIKVIVSFDFVPKLRYLTLTFEVAEVNPDYAEHYQLRDEAHRLLEALPSFESVSAPVRKKASKKKVTTRRARR